MKNSVAKTEKADGEARRAGILAALRPGAEPQSAGALGEKFGVSRQVIVQDIALLRASGAPVISTNRGYVLSSPPRAERVFKVRHTEAEVGEELELIVRLGGMVKDVSVSHRVYGNIRADLGVQTPLQVSEFVRSIRSGASRPLMLVTDGYHYHTVTAPDEKTLDEIEKGLKERGFLVTV